MCVQRWETERESERVFFVALRDARGSEVLCGRGGGMSGRRHEGLARLAIKRRLRKEGVRDEEVLERLVEEELMGGAAGGGEQEDWRRGRDSEEEDLGGFIVNEGACRCVWVWVGECVWMDA